MKRIHNSLSFVRMLLITLTMMVGVCYASAGTYYLWYGNNNNNPSAAQNIGSASGEGEVTWVIDGDYVKPNVDKYFGVGNTASYTSMLGLMKSSNDGYVCTSICDAVNVQHYNFSGTNYYWGHVKFVTGLSSVKITYNTSTKVMTFEPWYGISCTPAKYEFNDKVTLTVSHGKSPYKWYSSTDGGTVFTEILGETGESITVVAGASTVYKCVDSDSKSATITVYAEFVLKCDSLHTKVLFFDSLGTFNKNTSGIWDYERCESSYVAAGGRYTYDTSCTAMKDGGHYAVLSNPRWCGYGDIAQGANSCGCTTDDCNYWFRKDFYDHTQGGLKNDKYGGMLMFNCGNGSSSDNDVMYLREISGLCKNTYIRFSLFVANAAKESSTDKIKVKFQLLSSDKSKILAEYTESNLTFVANWKEVSAMFNSGENETVWIKVINKEAAGGSGNDVLLDDISFSVCTPESKLYADIEEKEGKLIPACGVPFTLRSAINSGALPTPYYIWQNSTDGTSWSRVPGSTAGSGETFQNLTITPSSGVYYRVIIANSQSVAEDVERGATVGACGLYSITNTVNVVCDDLAASLALTPDVVCEGVNDVKYTLTITNPTAAEYVTEWKISLPECVDYQSSTPSIGSYTAGVWSIPSLGPTGATLEINAKTNTTGTNFTAKAFLSKIGTTTFATYNDAPAKSRSSKDLKINALPTIESATGGSRCGAGTVTLSATASSGASVRWYAAASGGDVLSTGESYATPSISATTTYYAEAYNGTTGCVSSSRTAVTATVNSVPTASISGGDAVCQGGSLTLTGSGAANYSWNGGGYTTSNTYNVVTTSAGSQTIKLKVKDANGCESAEVSKSVTVNALPTASITGGDAVCQGGTLTLTGSGATNYSWNGGAYSTTNSFNVNTTSAVEQNIKLKVKDGNGCESAETSKNVTVNATPTISVTTAAACAPDLLTYSVGVTVSEGTVTCDKTASITNVGNVWTISGVTAGQNCTLTVTTTAGCTNTLSVTAPDCSCPVIAAPTGAVNNSYCAGSAKTAISVDAAASGYRIDWYDAATSGTKVVTGASFTPTAAGTYYAEMVEIVSGCKSSTRTAATLTENALPTASITSPITVIDCNNTSITITANTDAANATYAWSTGATTQTIDVTDAGTYYVTVTNTDNSCSKQSADHAVTKNITEPSATISGGTKIDCTVTSVTLTAGTDATNATYLWSTGATTSSINVSDAGDYTVTVTNTDNGCSKTSATHSVSKDASIPTASITGGSIINCTTTSVTLSAVTDITPLSNAKYEWSNGATTSTTTVSDAGSYTVTITNTATGCSATSSAHTVSKNVTEPSATVSGGTVLNCNIGSVTLTAGTDATNATYLWSTGATTQTIDVTDAGTYYVTVTNTDNGCSKQSANHAVTKNITEPSATISGGTKIDCTVTSVTLTAGTDATNATYLWSTGATTSSITVSDAGSYTVTVTNTDNGCSKTSATHSVSKDASIPTASITGGSIINCTTTSVTLSAVTDITPLSNAKYEWSNGATTSTTTVSDGGSYTVTITNTATGCSATSAAHTVSKNVTEPTATVSGGTVLNCNIGSVTLTAGTDATNATYLWSTGATTQTIDVTDAGTYYVTVTNTDNGCSKQSADHAVTKNITEPSATISGGTKIDCTVTSVTLTAGTDATNATYLWSTGATTSSINVSDAGDYTVTVTNTDNGCSKTSATHSVSKDASIPTASITGGSIINCTTTSVTLSAVTDITPLSNAKYEWSNGATTSTTTVSDAGSYTVTITNTATGCSATSSAHTVSKNVTEPTATVSGGTVLNCNIGSVTLTAGTDATNATYLWSTGATTQTIDVTDSGTYYVTVTNTDNGCSKQSADHAVTKNVTEPSATISGGTKIDCVTTSVTLTANTDATNATYLWSTGATTSSITVSDAGSYTVTITNTDNGCSKTSAAHSVSKDATIPTASITGGDIINCTTTSVTLSAVTDITPLSNAKYEWSNGATTSTTTVSDAGSYTVTITNTATGCSNTSDQFTVTKDIEKPTATITGDDEVCKNKTLQLTGSGADSYSWNGGAYSTVNTYDVVTTSAGLQTITLKVKKSSNGCESDVTTKDVTVKNCDVYTLNITANPEAVCKDNDTEYTLSLTNGATNDSEDIEVTINLPSGQTEKEVTPQTGTYTAGKWSIPSLAQGATTTLTYKATVSEQSKLVAFVSSSNGNNYTIADTPAKGEKEIAINPNPTLTYKVFDAQAGTEITTPQPYKLDCTVPSIRVELAGGATYLWDDAKTEQNRTISNAGTYSVKAISDKGCESEQQTITVEANKYKPVIKLSSKDDTGTDNTLLTCYVQELTLDVDVLNPDVAKNITYEWTYTGGSSTEKSIKVTEPDTYKMVAKAENGCYSDENQIVVTQDIRIPVARIEAPTDTLTCAEGTTVITLIASADVANCTFEWNDGSQGKTLNVTTEGEYSVKAIGTNGCVSLPVDTTVVDKRQTPEIEITSSAEKITCENVILTASSESLGMTYIWDDYVKTEGAELEVSKGGTYSVKGTNRYSCTGEASFTIEEDKTAPQVSITPNTGILTCKVTYIEAEAKETSGLTDVSYKWNDGKTTAKNRFTEKGIYKVTVTNNETACSTTATVTITENKQYPIISLQSLSAVCLPATVDISEAVVESSSKYDSIQYYYDATGLLPMQSTVVDVETKQIFYVQGFGVDGSGCEGKQIYSIEIVLKDMTPTPIVKDYDECPVAESRSLKDQVVSDKSKLTFYDTAAGGAPRSDMFDASKENTDATYYVTNTEYGKCESAREAILVHIDGTVDIELTSDDDEVYAGQQEVTVTATPTKEAPVNNYKWQKNAVALPDTDNEVTTLLYANTKFTVTAEGRCNSVTKDITVRALWPTLITPKTGANGHFAKGCDITVFNRFNEQVYHGTDGWDGTLDCNFAKKGEIASPGVYYYFINLPDGGTHRGTLEVVKF